MQGGTPLRAEAEGRAQERVSGASAAPRPSLLTMPRTPAASPASYLGRRPTPSSRRRHQRLRRPRSRAEARPRRPLYEPRHEAVQRQPRERLLDLDTDLVDSAKRKQDYCMIP